MIAMTEELDIPSVPTLDVDKFLRSKVRVLNEMLWDLQRIPEGHPARQASVHIGNAVHTIVTGEPAFRIARRRKAKDAVQVELPEPPAATEEPQ